MLAPFELAKEPVEEDAEEEKKEARRMKLDDWVRSISPEPTLSYPVEPNEEDILAAGMPAAVKSQNRG